MSMPARSDDITDPDALGSDSKGQDAEAMAKFFDTDSANDHAGMAVGAGRPNRMLKWYMGRLEGVVGGGGTAVGGAISLADLLLYNKFAENLSEAEMPDAPAYKRAPFNDAQKMAKELVSARGSLVVVFAAFPPLANAVETSAVAVAGRPPQTRCDLRRRRRPPGHRQVARHAGQAGLLEASEGFGR